MITERDARGFWAKVDGLGGTEACWEWRACRDSVGHGLFKLVVSYPR